jgi:hypothetical protein
MIILVILVGMGLLGVASQIYARRVPIGTAALEAALLLAALAFGAVGLHRHPTLLLLAVILALGSFCIALRVAWLRGRERLNQSRQRERS